MSKKGYSGLAVIRTCLRLACCREITGYEPTGLGSNTSLNSHVEILDALCGLSEPISSLYKEDNKARLSTYAQGMAAPVSTVGLGKRREIITVEESLCGVAGCLGGQSQVLTPGVPSGCESVQTHLS